MDNSIVPYPHIRHAGGTLYEDSQTEKQVESRLRMESMSRVACALIFQTARDLVCARRKLCDPDAHAAKAVRKAAQRVDEISRWARTVHPLRYADGGIPLAGAIATINVHQEYRGGRRIEYEVVKRLLFLMPQRLAVVDGPAEFRTLGQDLPRALVRVVASYENDHPQIEAEEEGVASEFAEHA